MARKKKELPPLPRPSVKSSITVSTVISAIRHKALPWIEQGPPGGIIIPRSDYEGTKRLAALESFDVTYRPVGKRVISRIRPNGFQTVSARWPSDGIEAKFSPVIACTVKGSTELRLNDYLLHCKEGSFILIPAGMAHPDGSTVHLEGEMAAERSCDILWLGPMGDILKVWFCRCEGGKHIGLPSIYLDQKSLCVYMDALFEHLHDRNPVRGTIREGLLTVLMASILNEIEEGRFFRWLPQAAPVDEGDGQTDPIKRAHIYIRQHLGEPLTVESVARHSFMSRSQFAKKFTDQTGETFNQFLTRCRLEEAKLRLSTSTVQIAGIGRHVGLKPRQFNQLFRQHTGQTPGSYRRLHQSEPSNSAI